MPSCRGNVRLYILIPFDVGYFMPQFTEATDIITLKSVIFPMRFCVYLKNSELRVVYILHSNIPFYSANNAESNGVLHDVLHDYASRTFGPRDVWASALVQAKSLACSLYLLSQHVSRYY